MAAFGGWASHRTRGINRSDVPNSVSNKSCPGNCSHIYDHNDIYKLHESMNVIRGHVFGVLWTVIAVIPINGMPALGEYEFGQRLLQHLRTR